MGIGGALPDSCGTVAAVDCVRNVVSRRAAETKLTGDILKRKGFQTMNDATEVQTASFLLCYRDCVDRCDSHAAYWGEDYAYNRLPFVTGQMLANDCAVLLAECDAYRYAEEVRAREEWDRLETRREQGVSVARASSRALRAAARSALTAYLTDVDGSDGIEARVDNASEVELTAALEALGNGEAAEVVLAALPGLTWTVRCTLSVSASVEVGEAANSEDAEETALEMLRNVTACGGGCSFSLDSVDVDEVEADS